MPRTRPPSLVIAPALALLAALAAVPAAAQGRLPAPAATAPLSPAAGEVIVAFRPGAETVRRHPVLERLDAVATQQALAARAAALGQRVGRPLVAGAPAGRGVQVVRAEGVDAATLARQLAADPEVLYAVPNGRKRIVAAPNDPLYPETGIALRPSGPASGQWYLRAPTATVVSGIDIEAAWSRTRGDAGVVVAVLDTGVRFEHPDLGRVATGGRLLPGFDFVGEARVANDGQSEGLVARPNGVPTPVDWDSDPSDPGDWVSAADVATELFRDCGPSSSSSWHGTRTASLVGAATDDGIGMAGTAPGVRVLPVRVLGKCFGYDSDIIAGMRWAAGLPVDGAPPNPTPAKVLNLSLGGQGSCSAAYQTAVDEIVAAGVTVVAAAGNSAGGPVNEPANCRGVIGVLALRHAGTKVGFSDMGPEISIAAPGGNCVNVSAGSRCLYPILAASNSGTRGPSGSNWTDGFNISVGTSFASPLVAGVAGLMVSQRPELTPAQLKAALQATARPFPTTGADNGPDDPTPVPSCTRVDLAGASGQCYCTTGLCGAGMLDAGAAVAAVSGAVARIDADGTPTVGLPITLSAAASLATPGATLTSWSWTLVSADAGVASGFASATNASTATLVPAAAGAFTVRVTVTDSAGSSSSATSTFTAVAATPPPPAGGGGGGVSAGGGGGGGGASAPLWLAALLLAAGLLERAARRR